MNTEILEKLIETIVAKLNEKADGETIKLTEAKAAVIYSIQDVILDTLPDTSETPPSPAPPDALVEAVKMLALHLEDESAAGVEKEMVVNGYKWKLTFNREG